MQEFLRRAHSRDVQCIEEDFVAGFEHWSQSSSSVIVFFHVILSVSHRESGIQRGCNSPTGAYLVGFVLRQRSQMLTYCPMYLDI